MMEALIYTLIYIISLGFGFFYTYKTRDFYGVYVVGNEITIKDLLSGTLIFWYIPVVNTLFMLATLVLAFIYFIYKTIVKYTGIDKQINTLISLSQNLKYCADIERPIILNRIQQRANAIWEFNFDLLNGKEGHIRNQMLGGSLSNLGDLKPI